MTEPTKSTLVARYQVMGNSWWSPLQEDGKPFLKHRLIPEQVIKGLLPGAIIEIHGPEDDNE